MNSRMLQRRSSERFRTALKVRITGEGDGEAIECLLWDLSATAARLVCLPPADLPLGFELLVPTEGASARVRLIWTAGNEYGVMFTD